MFYMTTFSSSHVAYLHNDKVLQSPLNCFLAFVLFKNYLLCIEFCPCKIRLSLFIWHVLVLANEVLFIEILTPICW